MTFMVTYPFWHILWTFLSCLLSSVLCCIIGYRDFSRVVSASSIVVLCLMQSAHSVLHPLYLTLFLFLVTVFCTR